MRPRVLLGAVAALALVVVTGCSGDEGQGDELQTQPEPVAAERDAWQVGLDQEVVVVGADELSDRQVEMIEVVHQYFDAWNSHDGELAASYMTANGHIPGDWIGASVEDGSLQRMIDEGEMSDRRIIEPVVVVGQFVILVESLREQTGTVPSAGVSALEFISSGKAKIMVDHWDIRAG